MEGKLKVRKVKKIGGSLTVIIPKDLGLEDGDYVSVDRVGNSNSILLTKVVREVGA
jgi:antitoxin component of MazEF toxin-antitoxin module